MNVQFRLDDIHDLTKNQIRERTMAKFGSMVHYVVNERLDVFTKRMELIGIGESASLIRGSRDGRDGRVVWAQEDKNTFLGGQQGGSRMDHFVTQSAGSM